MDIRIHQDGSMVGLEIVSDTAKTWVDENVDSEGYQWLGNTLWVEARFAGTVAHGAINDGLTVE